MLEQVDCKVCGRPTYMIGDGRCTNCWEVESRLEIYLNSPKAREHVYLVLKRKERERELFDELTRVEEGDGQT